MSSTKKVGKLKLTNDFKKKLESSLGHLTVVAGGKPSPKPPPPPRAKAKSIIDKAKKRLIIGEDLEPIKNDPPKPNQEQTSIVKHSATPQQITSTPAAPASIVINNNISYPQPIPETYNYPPPKQPHQINLDNKGFIMNILNKQISVKHLAVILLTLFSGYMWGRAR